MEQLDGIIVINKSKNYTSHDVVAKVRKILNVKKVGHTGTLDPNATGVLPLLIGNGTKLSKYLIEHDKEYVVTLKLGTKTDTADIEGKILEKQEYSKEDLEKIFNKENIENVLKTFVGKQEQIPPIYSAIKVKGKKLYEYARDGQNVEIKPRNIEIYSICLLQIKAEVQQIIFVVKCSKGTYIRSLCEDIASKLNTIGYMEELQRTQVGRFKIEDAVTIDDLEGNIEKYLITIESFFEQKDKINLDNKQFELLINGVKLETEKKDDIYSLYNNNKFVGIGIVENKKLKRELLTTNFILA